MRGISAVLGILLLALAAGAFLTANKPGNDPGYAMPLSAGFAVAGVGLLWMSLSGGGKKGK